MRDVEAWRKDGSSFPVEIALGSSTVGGQPAVLAIVRDVTDRRALEERVRQTQKLDAIGGLAGGIAHDFNNLLSIILSYSSLLGGDLTPGDPMREDLDEIHKAATRATDLTRQLLAFGRKQILHPTPTNLNDTVKKMHTMLKRLIGEDIEYVTLADPSLGATVVDPSQVEQVIMNLVVNARDAMPRRRWKLTVETANGDPGRGLRRSAARRRHARPLRHAGRHRHRLRDGCDDAIARVRAVLHHERSRSWYGARTLRRCSGSSNKAAAKHLALQRGRKRKSTFKIYFPRSDAQVTSGTSSLQYRTCNVGRRPFSSSRTTKRCARSPRRSCGATATTCSRRRTAAMPS